MLNSIPDNQQVTVILNIFQYIYKYIRKKLYICDVIIKQRNHGLH